MQRTKYLFIVAGLFVILLAACGSQTPTEVQTPTDVQSPTQADTSMEAETPQDDMDEVDLAAAFQKASCTACHIIPGVPGAVGTIGPDLTRMGEIAEVHMNSNDYTGEADSVEDYIIEAIVKPDIYLAPDCGGTACSAGIMPASLVDLLSEEELEHMVEFLASLPDEDLAAPEDETEPVALGDAPVLTDEEFDSATQIFFDRCAGCHGVLRKGATGPDLTPENTLPKGTAGLAAIIYNGTPRGMPDWGKQGILTEDEAELMAKFIQIEPPQPVEMSLEQMMDTWDVIVPLEDRPTEPQHDRDWENFFAVTLRDAGQVAIIDGDTYEVVTKVDTGYAVHISRMSATGRYIYTIGRDGKLALIDTWMKVPDKIAEVKTCYDARSVDGSKYNGEQGDFTDLYAIVGCYWPPHFVMLDGQTLEPFKVVSTRSYTYDTEEYHPEPRVAAIVASHNKPEWIVNIKETGQVWLVDYTDVINPTIKMIEAERFLHDGGWDSTQRYFLVAANQANKIAVIDSIDGELEALVDASIIPHPGRGANWIDPEFGPVWGTSHLGAGSLVAIGTDPEGHPENAWKVVRDIELLGGGSLFVKTHPNSDWIWVDFGLSSDEVLQRTVCVIAKDNPTEAYRCWEAADYGRAVHFEYNKQGTEVWLSIWGTADEPGKTGEIVVYDDKTLEEIARIPDLVTPTGKFNVYNTVHDIY